MLLHPFPNPTGQGPEGPVRVARREDLIALKRLRNSKQDEADIEALGDGA
ncbi:MAG: hypothetical protein HC901_01660 [Bdellovibrionaceae bacterium]|nr:hypothetical protein [Pseudobdellovibrionaceae bacterium]